MTDVERHEGWAINRILPRFSQYSGLHPGVQAVGLREILFDVRWDKWEKWSWRIGDCLMRWGNNYYGCMWNSLTPWFDEWGILCQLPKRKIPYPIHFFWGEFAAPKRVAPYHRKGGRVIVSVHCSARRWEHVWTRPDGYANADAVVLTSDSQRPFVEKVLPKERVRRILHGVVSNYFTPGNRHQTERQKLRLFLMGKTERNHVFAAEIAKKLDPEKFEWRVRTTARERSVYRDIPCVTMLDRMSDDEMREEYRQADLLCMPMLDSAANNVFLESMACGTPVMTNEVGGAREYMGNVNLLMPQAADSDAWVGELERWRERREVLEGMRAGVRTWAEGFDWKRIAPEYWKLYGEVCGWNPTHGSER
ncbi:MAG: glycosyltransferase family 4 protein [Kiritimatiellae bacterium]|nr:glycosyltransferase family 4 protein [Kiritimatiellia bacterium]